MTANVAIAPFVLLEELRRQLIQLVQEVLERGFEPLETTPPRLAPAEPISSTPCPPSLPASKYNLPYDETDSCVVDDVDEPLQASCSAAIDEPQPDVPVLSVQTRLPSAPLPTSCRLLHVQTTLSCAPCAPNTHIRCWESFFYGPGPGVSVGFRDTS
jgi:hypothetical protein